jgi:hypothetical protein
LPAKRRTSRVSNPSWRRGEEIPAVVRVLTRKEARRRELAAKLAEARQKGAHPLSESWGEAKSLLEILDAAPDERETRLRLREAMRRIVEEIRIPVVPSGRDRVAAVQVWFAGGAHGVRHRDYVIYHRAALAAGDGHKVRRPSSWEVRTFASTGVDGADLRDPKATVELERLLVRNLAALKGKGGDAAA